MTLQYKSYLNYNVYLWEDFPHRVVPVVGSHEWEVEDVEAVARELKAEEIVDEEDLADYIHLLSKKLCFSHTISTLFELHYFMLT